MDMMKDFMEIVQEWGPYLGLPIIIAFFTQGLKKLIPFFKTHIGVRFIHFLPLVLGVTGGFLLPEDSWKNQVLIGGGLGCLSLFLYKLVTVSLASKAKLAKQIAKKAMEIEEEE